MEITAKNVAVIFVKIKNVTVLLANVFKVVPWDIKAHTVRKVSFFILFLKMGIFFVFFCFMPPFLKVAQNFKTISN